VLVEDARGEVHTVELEAVGDELLLEARNRRAPNAAERFVMRSASVLEQVEALMLDEGRAGRECMRRYGVVL
jgi:hypothetical protein